MSHDPETGCGLLIVLGVASLAFWVAVFALFGWEAAVRLALICAGIVIAASLWDYGDEPS